MDGFVGGWVGGWVGRTRYFGLMVILGLLCYRIVDYSALKEVASNEVQGTDEYCRVGGSRVERLLQLPDG